MSNTTSNPMIVISNAYGKAPRLVAVTFSYYEAAKHLTGANLLQEENGKFSWTIPHVGNVPATFPTHVKTWEQVLEFIQEEGFCLPKHSLVSLDECLAIYKSAHERGLGEAGAWQMILLQVSRAIAALPYTSKVEESTLTEEEIEKGLQEAFASEEE